MPDYLQGRPRLAELLPVIDDKWVSMFQSRRSSVGLEEGFFLGRADGTFFRRRTSNCVAAFFTDVIVFFRQCPTAFQSLYCFVIECAVDFLHLVRPVKSLCSSPVLFFFCFCKERGVHLCELEMLTAVCLLQVLQGRFHSLEHVQMVMSVNRLRSSGCAKEFSYSLEPFCFRLLGKGQVLPVSL